MGGSAPGALATTPDPELMTGASMVAESQCPGGQTRLGAVYVQAGQPRRSTDKSIIGLESQGQKNYNVQNNPQWL